MDWGICGIALLEADWWIYEALSEQDGLYTLVIPDVEGNFSARVIGSIVEVLYAPQDPSAVIRKMADKSIRLITLTITEGGYNLTSDGNFDWNNSSVLWDLQHPEQPKTIFGYLYAALKLRKMQEIGGLTIQSCDNIEHNGDIMQRMLYAYIDRVDPAMIGWLDEHIAFPNSMVDRITPVTTEELKNALVEKFDLFDTWPVVCEAFYQWIIEDSYAAGRPDWEKVGGQLVSDVTPYEKMKIRLLNGGHTLIGLAGYLLGYQYIHESVSDPAIENLLRRYMDEEVTPTLDELQGIDLNTYKDTLVERFKNPFIKDKVSRIISGSSAKFPKFILPVVLDQLKTHQSVYIAALLTACWYQYLKLNVAAPNTVQDAMVITLLESISSAEREKDPLLFLDHPDVFGDIRKYEIFTNSFLSQQIVSVLNEEYKITK
jgi:mannitol 2-dehydrogenase